MLSRQTGHPQVHPDVPSPSTPHRPPPPLTLPALLNRDHVKTRHSKFNVLTHRRFFFPARFFSQAGPNRTSRLVPFDSGLSSNAVFPASPLVISQSRPASSNGVEGVWMRQKRRFIILLLYVTRSSRLETGPFGGACQYKVWGFFTLAGSRAAVGR